MKTNETPGALENSCSQAGQQKTSTAASLSTMCSPSQTSEEMIIDTIDAYARLSSHGALVHAHGEYS